jgi:sec-independent protein translocase protein TatC
VDPAVPASVVAGQQVLLRNFSPVEAFFVVFHVAIYAGLAVASPFLLYFLGGFVLPALRPKEKRYVYYGLGFSVGLFVLGVIFCYFLLLPVSLEASRMYSHWLGFAANEWQASEYIGFVTKFMFGMGLGFQLPVVLLTLVRIGLINYRQLIAWRRYVIVLNLILGAVLTTPEVVTQLLLAIPLQLLYEISILVAWLWARKLRRQAAATEET